MKNTALEVINKIYNYGYEAYIVGGFVRDNILGIESKDVDITTNATPMELANIFPEIQTSNFNYGTVILIYKNCRFEITTYRKDSDYLDNRHPVSVTYVNDLETDILRRDFTINTICIDKDDHIVDLLQGQIDLKNKYIRTVIESDKSFKTDALRILRAIRFSATFDFALSEEIKIAIKNNHNLLRNLSYERKKQELDRLFTSSKEKGIKLLKEFHLEEDLELDGIDRVKDCSDLIGIWAMINPKNYKFTSSESELITKVNEVYNLDNLDNQILYKYGLYVNVLAGINKGIEKKEILTKYEELPIKTRDEININAQEICDVLNKKPGKFISDIYSKLEELILTNKLINDKSKIIEYINSQY